MNRKGFFSKQKKNGNESIDEYGLSSQLAEDIRLAFDTIHGPLYVSNKSCLPNTYGKKRDDMQSYIESVYHQYNSNSSRPFEQIDDFDQIFGQKMAEKLEHFEKDQKCRSQPLQRLQQLKHPQQPNRTQKSRIAKSGGQSPQGIIEEKKKENEKDKEEQRESLHESSPLETRDDLENEALHNKENSLISVMRPYFSCGAPNFGEVDSLAGSGAQISDIKAPFYALQCAPNLPSPCHWNDDGSAVTSNTDVEEMYMLERMNSWNTGITTKTATTNNSFITVENDSVDLNSLSTTEKVTHYDDNGNVIHPLIFKAHEMRRQLNSLPLQKPKSAFNTKKKVHPSIQKVENGKLYRKKIVQFDHPPVKSLKQIPRTDPDDIDKLFFSPEELEKFAKDDLDTNISEVMKLINSSGSFESELSRNKEPHQKSSSLSSGRNPSPQEERNEKAMANRYQWPVSYSGSSCLNPSQQVQRSSKTMENNYQCPVSYSGSNCLNPLQQVHRSIKAIENNYQYPIKCTGSDCPTPKRNNKAMENNYQNSESFIGSDFSIPSLREQRYNNAKGNDKYSVSYFGSDCSTPSLREQRNNNGEGNDKHFASFSGSDCPSPTQRELRNIQAKGYDKYSVSYNGSDCSTPSQRALTSNMTRGNNYSFPETYHRKGMNLKNNNSLQGQCTSNIITGNVNAYLKLHTNKTNINDSSPNQERYTSKHI